MPDHVRDDGDDRGGHFREVEGDADVPAGGWTVVDDDVAADRLEKTNDSCDIFGGRSHLQRDFGNSGITQLCRSFSWPAISYASTEVSSAPC